MINGVPPLQEIKEIDDYFSALKFTAKHSLILIAVRDTSGFQFRETTASAMRGLGLTSSLQGAHGHSYIALVDRGIVIADRLSRFDESSLIENHALGDNRPVVTLFSSVFQKENTAILEIDGIDYSMNGRGLNIVVYSYVENRVIDSVSFDTHERGNPCSRRSISSIQSTVGMDANVSYRLLKSQLVALRRELRELKDHLSTNHEQALQLQWQLYGRKGESHYHRQKRFLMEMPPATGHIRKVQALFNILLRRFDEICRENSIQYWLCEGTLIGAIRHKGFIPWDDDADVFMLREDFMRFREAVKNEDDFFHFSFFDIDGPAWKNFGRGYKFALKSFPNPYSLDIFLVDNAGPEAQNQHSSLAALKPEMSHAVWGRNSIPGMPDNIPHQHHRGIWDNHHLFHACEQFIEPYIERYLTLLGGDGPPTALARGIDNFGEFCFYSIEDIFPLSEAEFEGRMYFVPRNPVAFLRPRFGDVFRMPADMLTHRHFVLKPENEAELDSVLSQFYIEDELATFMGWD